MKSKKKKLKITQSRGDCYYKTFDDTYLDPNFKMKVGEARSGYFDEASAEALCNDAGQSCAGIVRDRGVLAAGKLTFIDSAQIFEDGRDWILREKAILLTPDEYRFAGKGARSLTVPDNLQTKMKICQGQMSNVYPLER